MKNVTLYCRGCPRSEITARQCVSILKPKLNHVEEDSWEELENVDIGSGSQSLCWLVWVCMLLTLLSTHCISFFIFFYLGTSQYAFWLFSNWQVWYIVKNGHAFNIFIFPVFKQDKFTIYAKHSSTNVAYDQSSCMIFSFSVLNFYDVSEWTVVFSVSVIFSLAYQNFAARKLHYVQGFKACLFYFIRILE